MSAKANLVHFFDLTFLSIATLKSSVPYHLTLSLPLFNGLFNEAASALIEKYAFHAVLLPDIRMQAVCLGSSRPAP